MENPEVDNAETNPTAELQPDDVKKLMERVNQLESTNQRLLGESKDNAEKYRKVRDQEDSRKKLELEEQENWKGLLDKEKDDKFQLEAKYKDLKKNALKKDLDFTVAKLIDSPLAEGASVDDIIHHVLETGVVEISDDESEFLNVADAYNKVKESKRFLFDSKKAPMANAVPGQNAPAEKKLSKDELFKQALGVLHK